tara:strand:- start:85 stop:726 length:642 start_codon:yes stop_codon:yes gene_type:complete
LEINITDYPNSYAEVKLEKDESIIAEKGSFIFSDGEFISENKLELSSYKNIIAKLGGKSLSYVTYKAKESLSLVLGTRDNSELTLIEISQNNPILIKADAHFARTSDVGIKLLDTKITEIFDSGFWMNVFGDGYLILKGYGKILRMEINNDKPLLIEDASLIAMEEKIDFNTVDIKISDELKEYLKSGVEAPYSIKGNGVIWLQTKGRYSIQE